MFAIVGIFLIAMMILVILSVLKKGESKNRNAKRNPIKGKRIITMNEQPTFMKLKEALPEHIILAQVAFSAFMTAQGYATRNLFNRKVADFVVLDKAFNIVAIVELDDSSHKGKEKFDAERDAFIQEAGFKVIRYKRTPELAQIHSDFNIAISSLAQVSTEPDLTKTNFVADAIIIERDEPSVQPTQHIDEVKLKS
jgi:very-short-patch-repair endonuclease